MMENPLPRPLRVLHCPWNLAGQQAPLAAAERRLGLDSRNVVLFEKLSGFPSDEALASQGKRAQIELARFRLLWRAMTWADVIHFSFGQSILLPHPFPESIKTGSWAWDGIMKCYARLLWYRDLQILRALGKTLFVSWQGDDARQSDRSRELFDISIAHEVDETYYLPGSDAWKRRAIARMGRFAHGQYALNPDLLHVLPPTARFLPYASFDPQSVRPRFAEPSGSRPLTIAHAPSHRGAKGTQHVLSAIETLRREGIVFQFTLVEGVGRQEALDRMAAADIVVDQLLAGWYGGLGVEAMALGKVLVAYIRRGDLKFVPPSLASDLPIVDATPATIADVLRRLLSTPRSELRAIGERGRAYVERHHAPDNIARTTVSDYLGARAGQPRR